MAAVRLLALAGVLLAASILTGCGATESSSSSKKPRLEMSAAEIANRPPLDLPSPQGPAPRGLVIRDLRKGTGAVMKRGDTMLVVWAEASYDRASNGAPDPLEKELKFTFGKYIEGWEKGIPGMQVGGRRELIVPTRLGDTGTTMVYMIDLLGIEPV